MKTGGTTYACARCGASTMFADRSLYSALQLRRSFGGRKQVTRSATKSRDPREKPQRSSDLCGGKGTFARSRQSPARAKVPAIHQWTSAIAAATRAAGVREDLE